MFLVYVNLLPGSDNHFVAYILHALEPLPLLLITLGAAAVAFLLTATRQPRPLPRLTQGVLLLSTLTLVGSAIYAGLLVGAALSWCLLLLLLLLDEFLLLRGQVRRNDQQLAPEQAKRLAFWGSPRAEKLNS